MKKLLLAGTALAALAAGSANAADLARPVPVYRAPPPVVTYFTWTGCYVGGNGGGLWARKDWSDDVAIPASAAFPAVPAGASFSSHDVNGGLGGIQGGCNYQSATGCSASRATTTGQCVRAAIPICCSRRRPTVHHPVARVSDRSGRLCLGPLPALREGRRRLDT